VPPRILTLPGQGIMMPYMRTTLTLDPDVVQLLEEEAHRQRRPFKQIVNDAIRRGLGARSPGRMRRYRLVPHESAVLPGIDPARLNQLADELEDEASTERLSRP
jgi:hypothetical protein